MSFASPIWLLALLLVPVGAGRPAPGAAGGPALRGALPGRADSSSPRCGTRARWRRHIPAALAAGRVAALARRAGPPARHHRGAGRARRRSCSCSTTPARWTPTDVQPDAPRRRREAANTFIDQLPAQRPASASSRSPARPTTWSRRRRPTTRPPRRAIDSQTADRRDRHRRRAGGRASTCSSEPAGDAHAAIVLLSDGAANAGPGPGDGRRATPPGRRSPIYTVALGTAERRRCRTPTRSVRRSRCRPTRS